MHPDAAVVADSIAELKASISDMIDDYDAMIAANANPAALSETLAAITVARNWLADLLQMR